MIGTVIKWNGHFGSGFIKEDETGDEFFLHESDVMNSSKVKVGNIFQFDVIDEGKKNLKAVNAYKVGHGPVHPFIKDLERVAESISNSNILPEDKLYRLNDIQMLINYFTKARDVTWCPDVRKTFRPKINIEKGEITNEDNS